MSAYFLENFGCRATQADGAAIEQQLVQRGLTRTPTPADAEIVVLNTCTVTAAADADARATIRRIHRENPHCQIIVTGCYAQRAPAELAAMPGVSYVVGNSHKGQVASLASVVSHGPVMCDSDHIDVKRDFVQVSQLVSKGEAPFPFVGDIFAHTELMAAPVFEGGARTRPNLKVQDGCDNRCSFCVIPFVRGNSRSLPLDSVLGECEALVAAGYREIVISGINLGRWGRDFPAPARLETLVSSILDRTDVQRLRISSVEPMDWSPELIRLMACSKRICKHAHVPLQSGSDRVLRMMHRKYRPWHYADCIKRIRAAMPHAAIGADVMVGFPGETDELFEENRRFIAELPFTYLHVFTYSSRPGTAAEKMPDHVDIHLARERNRILRDLIAEKNRAFRQQFVGRVLEAITLHGTSDGSTEALTNNFLKLHLAGGHFPNQLVRASITGLTQTGLSGELLQ
ncbi:MAG TPA: tRNA (N(6)-L-threonylcarbamoyladenosine(37)-C(2))-methylthiotransferase MtaB [Terriglobales bacterium]|nr:tRNA (N(6)-L-threonylcarbamoyladenosine(37)-C(2))-methylthiotransferase MtaB [Terriglobales bacterium]